MTPYSNPWRPLYEGYAVVLWLVVGALAWGIAQGWAFYARALYWLSLVALAMALTWLPGLVRGIDRREWLRGRALEFIAPEQFAGRMPAWAGYLWAGWGFDWEARHAQAALDLMRADPERFVPRDVDRLGATWLFAPNPSKRQKLAGANTLTHPAGLPAALGSRNPDRCSIRRGHRDRRPLQSG